MVGWFLLFALMLAAGFAYLLAGGETPDTSAWPFAAAVAAALLALYALATRGGSESGLMARRMAWIGAALLTIAITYYASIHGGLLDTLVQRMAGGETQSGVMLGDERDGLRAVMIRRNSAGQFLARGNLNDTPVEFLVDTGASTVVLRQTDAQRAGIDVKAIDYTVPLQTANGATNAAAARIRVIDIGGVRVEGVEALVAAPGSLNENLLGMTFLRRLRSYELSGDFITLRE